MSITKQELIEGAYEITGGDIRAKLERLMTVTQHVTDLCLNENGLTIGGFHEQTV